MGRVVGPLMVALALAACGGSEKKAAGADGPDKIVTGETPTSRHSAVPDMDEEDEGGMEIEGLRGTLAPEDIQAGIQGSSAELTSCYQKAHKKMRFLNGSVELKFRVARDGTVAAVQLAKSDLGAWPVERCLLETSREIHFAKPRGGEAEFSVPLDFSSGRGALTWWDEARADQEVKKVIGELGKCAGEAKVAEPSNVWVTLYVGARGVVKSVGFASPSSAPIEDAWADCAAAVAGAWTLSDPRGRMAKAGFRFNPE
jgi:TonB family protein